MQENIIIPNQKKFDEIILNLKKWWLENLVVFTDFDRTLTDGNSEGVNSIIRKENMLWEEFNKKNLALYEHYRPIEIDTNISLDDKKKYMVEWWSKVFDLFISYELHKNHILKAAKSPLINLRNWVKELFKFLIKNGVPVVVVTAAGIWKDTLDIFFKEEWLAYKKLFIEWNDVTWWEDGKMIEYKKPIIHTFNKNEKVFEKETLEAIERKKNVILLWDSVWDIWMIGNFKYENLLKIGFLNHFSEEHLKEFSENFDMIIINNWDFEAVNSILEKL